MKVLNKNISYLAIIFKVLFFISYGMALEESSKALNSQKLSPPRRTVTFAEQGKYYLKATKLSLKASSYFLTHHIKDQLSKGINSLWAINPLTGAIIGSLTGYEMAVLRDATDDRFSYLKKTSIIFIETGAGGFIGTMVGFGNMIATPLYRGERSIEGIIPAFKLGKAVGQNYLQRSYLNNCLSPELLKF